MHIGKQTLEKIDNEKMTLKSIKLKPKAEEYEEAKDTKPKKQQQKPKTGKKTRGEEEEL